jgi:hypothetical protein
MKNVETLYATHRLFTEAVLAVLPRMRFRPAVMNCRRVPWSVQQAFRFSLQ